MKYLCLVAIIAIFFTSSCKTTYQKKTKTCPEITHLKGDSTTYEVVVFDPEFESWYAMHYSQASDHSESYYKNWNKQYVDEWNYKASTGGKYSHFFLNSIDYDFNISYGIDVERKLFWYFKFVETYLKIPILPYGPSSHSF
ncbi:MAG: DUF6146 family protein [Bacteroidota bacterium]|nr:DUF6146 family protein [Bacteroidota bacterium]